MTAPAIALAWLIAAVPDAFARSSVTLFGVVDLGLRCGDNDTFGSNPSSTMQTPNGNASSRIGVRGVEDLGGGLDGTLRMTAPCQERLRRRDRTARSTSGPLAGITEADIAHHLANNPDFIERHAPLPPMLRGGPGHRPPHPLLHALPATDAAPPPVRLMKMLKHEFLSRRPASGCGAWPPSMPPGPGRRMSATRRAASRPA